MIRNVTYSYDKQSISLRVKKLRLQKGLSQQQVSNVLEIEQPSFGRKERGEIAFSVQDIITLSNFLEVSPHYIITGEELPEGENGTEQLEKMIRVLESHIDTQKQLIQALQTDKS